MNHNYSMQKLFNIYYLETKTEWQKIIRMPGFAIPALFFPLMFYIFFGIILNKSAMNGQMPIYMLATYGTFAVMGPGLFSFGVSMAMEKSQGWLMLKQAMPMPTSALIFARVAAASMFAIIILMLMFIVAAVFGNIQLHTYQWLLLFFTLLLGNLPFCVIGLYLGLKVKGQSAPAIVNLIYLPMALLSGLWMPIMLFPSWMQSLAHCLPSYHLAQLSLKIVQLDQGGNVFLHILIMMIFIITFTLLSFLAYRKMKF